MNLRREGREELRLESLMVMVVRSWEMVLPLGT